MAGAQSTQQTTSPHGKNAIVDSFLRFSIILWNCFVISVFHVITWLNNVFVADVFFFIVIDEMESLMEENRQLRQQKLCILSRYSETCK
jgi:hypothetical protein